MNDEELTVSFGRWFKINARGQRTVTALILALLVVLGAPTDLTAAVLGLIR